ncbi:MAG: malonate transporter subunit MadM, partial [Verrucomicrobiota bacterium]
MSPIVEKVLADYGLLTAFALVGLTMAIAYWASDKLTRGRLHGSAIAILIGLILAAAIGGKKGVADLPVLAGVGLMGGAMLRDLAIVATAFGVKLEAFAKSGFIGAVSLLAGLFTSFLVGGLIAYAFGYRDAVSITTIGAGAATYIVGPVTGAAIGASSEVIALSIAAGLVKA